MEGEAPSRQSEPVVLGVRVAGIFVEGALVLGRAPCGDALAAGNQCPALGVFTSSKFTELCDHL